MRPNHLRIGAALGLVAVAACSSADVEPREDAPGRLVIVGGALQSDNAAVYEAVFEGREGDGPLCVVPTASGDPEAAIEGAVETLAGYGGPSSAKGILITTADPSRALDSAVAAEFEGCSGFYFTGGSQDRIVDVFLSAGDTTPAYRSLMRRWREGAVVAGSSAGAAMMSRIMIAGGGSNEAVAHGISRGPGEDGVVIQPGMGFFEPILDQHFLARGRIGRLLVSASRPELPDIGFGIDENTALVVDGDSAVVVGASGVVLVDARRAEPLGPAGASGLRVALAGPGDVIDLGTFEVRRDAAKLPVSETETSLELPEDPFARWEFLRLIAGLAASAESEVVLTLPGATLRVVEEPDFSASMTGSTGGVQGTAFGLSAGDFRVDLRPTGG